MARQIRRETKIWFFEKRNPRTGEMTGDIVDANERTAWSYWNKPRFFYLIGWSDGRFIKLAAKIVGYPIKDERGIAIPHGETQKAFMRIAGDKEIEFAFNNLDKTRPRDMTKMGLGGAPLTDPILLAYLKALPGK